MKDFITIKGKIEQGYEWSAGIAGSHFLAELRDNGRIVGTRCPKCSQLMVPPRVFCEKCFVEAKEWEVAGNTGTIHSFTVSHIAVNAARLEKPVCLGLVDLDGGGGIFHFLDEVEPDQIKIGMKVEAVFKDKKERVGSITDIKYFRPIA